MQPKSGMLILKTRERQREEERDADNPFRYNTIRRHREREKMMEGKDGRIEKKKMKKKKYIYIKKNTSFEVLSATLKP